MTPVPRPPHDDLADFNRRGEQQRRRFHGHQPKRMADVIAQVVQRRGYAQVRAARSGTKPGARPRDRAFAKVTQPGALRRGTLEITAANSLVMQELTFEKERLLAAIQTALPTAGIKHLRFRVGQIN